MFLKSENLDAALKSLAGFLPRHPYVSAHDAEKFRAEQVLDVLKQPFDIFICGLLLCYPGGFG